MDRLIDVELVYALADQQTLLALSVPYGTTVRGLADSVGLAQRFPELDLDSLSLGVFGKAVSNPELWVLEPGERVEVYRPLLADPKEVRKQRAARLKAGR